MNESQMSQSESNSVNQVKRVGSNDIFNIVCDLTDDVGSFFPQPIREEGDFPSAHQRRGGCQTESTESK